MTGTRIRLATDRQHRPPTPDKVSNFGQNDDTKSETGAPPPSPTLDFIQRALSQYIHNYLGRVLGQGAALQTPYYGHSSTPSPENHVRSRDFAIKATILVDFHVIPVAARPRMTVQTHHQYSDAGRLQTLSNCPHQPCF